jgi:hypothetical protein
MAREKATITLDRDKVREAGALTGGRTMSDVVDLALDRLIASERLRRDIAAYAETPGSADEFPVWDLPARFDLGDEDIDYDALYGAPG